MDELVRLRCELYAVQQEIVKLGYRAEALIEEAAEYIGANTNNGSLHSVLSQAEMESEAYKCMLRRPDLTSVVSDCITSFKQFMETHAGRLWSISVSKNREYEGPEPDMLFVEMHIRYVPHDMVRRYRDEWNPPESYSECWEVTVSPEGGDR